MLGTLVGSIAHVCKRVLYVGFLVGGATLSFEIEH